MQHLEELRLRYKPPTILLLLVGESPPPNKGFFYDTTVPEGQLSRNTRKVFENMNKMKYASREEFLAQLKARHCYLTDLFKQRGQTIHKADKPERQKAVRQLTNILQKEKPRVVISVLKRIQEPVEEAVRRADVRVSHRSIYYPTRQFIPRYRSGLHAILSELNL